MNKLVISHPSLCKLQTRGKARAIAPKLAAAALLAAVLSACGGGSSGGAAETSNPTAPSTGGTSATNTNPSSPSAPSAGGTSTPPPTTAAAQSCNLPNFSKDLLERINAERRAGATCGGQAKPAVAALGWNTTLTDAAKLHSQDMIARNFFDHTNPSGQDAGDRVSAQGYNWNAVGENIAAGQRSVQQVMDGWMASSGHCNNIMNSNFAEVGVACVLEPNDPNGYDYYWTMVLARQAR
jgi:uncharacterized protein YkwD